MNVIKYMWQLPQNLLGLLVIFLTQAEYQDWTDDKKNNYWLTNKYSFGVSLGNYIIFGRLLVFNTDIRHEQGHQKQSLYLGWLYLPLIGLPSVLGNIWDMIFHKDWHPAKRIKWYYSLPWEKLADRLGGIENR